MILGPTSRPDLKHSISLPVPGSTATVLPAPPPPPSGAPLALTPPKPPATLTRREQLFGHLVSGRYTLGLNFHTMFSLFI